MTNAERRVFFLPFYSFICNNLSFAFCAHVNVIKYRETIKFSFERAQITLALVLSARAIVKPWETTLTLPFKLIMSLMCLLPDQRSLFKAVFECG